MNEETQDSAEELRVWDDFFLRNEINITLLPKL